MVPSLQLTSERRRKWLPRLSVRKEKSNKLLFAVSRRERARQIAKDGCPYGNVQLETTIMFPGVQSDFVHVKRVLS